MFNYTFKIKVYATQKTVGFIGVYQYCETVLLE